MDAIQRFTEHVVHTTYEMLPASALAATKTFILDTLGVGVANSTAPPVKPSPWLYVISSRISPSSSAQVAAIS